MLEQDENIQETKLRIKKYLELENVSFLTGAGTSFHLGAPIIREIPEELKKKYSKTIQTYFSDKITPSYEDLMNCLQADRFIKLKKGEPTTVIDATIHDMQKWLFNNCNTEKTKIANEYKLDAKLQADRFHYHEAFIKKVLQRPNNLKRANLFTTNYDMAFDCALDNLGVHYINGFMGVHNRCFRPEVYDYDFYYPGQSVTGKVHRAEKVIKYFKLHGSLSWVTTNQCPNNIYGIKEIPLNAESIINDESDPIKDDPVELLIYPCVSKKRFTLDLPYSELFRQFSQAITQSQSVLFCLGYSFNDEHINDIIKQALSIPSFTLIVANYSPKVDKDSVLYKLKLMDDKRIIVLEENNKTLSTFTGFVENVLPDLYEEEENRVVAETMQKVYPKKDNNSSF
jgi:NAD-dependent SIR2 family protein deacetylase